MTIKISDSLANTLLKGRTVEQALRGGFIRIFSGTEPATADAVLSGPVLLATIAADVTPVDVGVVGLLFNAPAARALAKDSSQTWAGKVVASGNASFFRFCSAPVETPTQAAASTSAAGGTLAAATYYYVVTAINAAGASLRSNQVSIVTTGATSSNTINWTEVDGATSYRVYRSTTSNAFTTASYYNVTATISNTNITGALSYLDTNAAADGTATPYAGDPGTAADSGVIYPRLQGSVGTSGTDIVLSAIVLTDNDSNTVGLSTFEIRVAA